MKQLLIISIYILLPFILSGQNFPKFKSSKKLGLYIRLSTTHKDSIFEDVSEIFNKFQKVELLEAVLNEKMVYRVHNYPLLKFDEIFDKNHEVQFKTAIIFKQGYFYIIMTDFVHVDLVIDKYPDAGGELENVTPKGAEKILSMPDWNRVKKDTLGYCKELRTALILGLVDRGHRVEIIEMNY